MNGMTVIRMDNAPEDFAAYCEYWDGCMAAYWGQPAMGSDEFLRGYREAYAQMEQQTAKALECER
jgi:hypothetical protein